jgi:hypothetical protein
MGGARLGTHGWGEGRENNISEYENEKRLKDIHMYTMAVSVLGM